MTLTQVTTGGVDENINIDSNTLKVDGTNNRVGIGVSNPAHELHVADASTPEIAVEDTTNNVKAYLGSSDSNGRIGTLSNHHFQFRTNDVERMRLDTSGNFSIGHAGSPDSLLTIGGNAITTAKPTVSIAPSSGNGSLTLRGGSPILSFDQTGGGDGTIIYDSGSDLIFKKGTLDSSSEVARINEDGSLLIGSSVKATAGTAQYAYLQIAGNTAGISGSVLALKRGEAASQMSDDDSLGTIIFTGTTGGDFASIRGAVDGSPSGSAFPGRIVFSTTASGGNTPTERVRIDSSGRLLVNTNSSFNDGSTIQLAGSDSHLGLKYTGTSGGNETQIRWFDKRDQANAVVANKLEDDGSGTYAASLVFKTSTAGTLSERVRIDRDGRLLVNCTSVSGNISNNTTRVLGNMHLGANMTLGKSGGDYDGIGYNVGWQASNGQYRYVVGDTAAFIKFGAGGGRIQTFTAGVGTAGNSISFTGGPYVASGGTSWSTGSDERLKTNLSPIENGLAKVGTLRAVTGRYLTDEESTSRAFLIAQDVQTVLPEAVDDYDPESLGLDYPAMIPLLVAALKEAKDKIETLETKVAALEAAG